MKIKIDPKIKKIIAMVKGKRALAVIRHIEKYGLVTTEDLEKMGYIHPPRAGHWINFKLFNSAVN